MRAILGMANRRDGGVIVLGVEETPAALQAGGVDAAVLPGWNHDDVAAAAASYADPGVSLSVTRQVRSGLSFVVVEVAEFERVPVICDRQFDAPGGETILKKRAVYVRTQTKPETTDVASHADLRDILELATERVSASFSARRHAPGYPSPQAIRTLRSPRR
jgi:hypothetical protein